jgi:amidase
VPTTAGSRAVAAGVGPAEADAPCVATARAAGARIVGKANLHELAAQPTGINPWFGTPTNPLDPTLIPGGSSSGSAVAVATDEADVAYGSDTGGSVRIPSACCGTVGLKTTWGRVPTTGVYPLSPTLDTVGPMAADVARTVLGMQLLEPGFEPAAAAAGTVGRLRFTGIDPRIDAAVDAALAAAELDVVDVEVPGWDAADELLTTVILVEAHRVNEGLRRDGISDDVLQMLDAGPLFEPAYDDAVARLQQWRTEVGAVFDRVELLALPTLRTLPPTPDEAEVMSLVSLCFPINVAGLPALSLPVPADDTGGLPASLQLVGPHRGEELLCATGAVVEAAVR